MKVDVAIWRRRHINEDVLTEFMAESDMRLTFQAGDLKTLTTN
jgi:hypothetical protein